MTFRGISEALLKLAAVKVNLEEKTIKGMIKAAILIRRDMEFTVPKIPVDLGNLRASWFVVTSKGQNDNKSPAFIGNEAAHIGETYKKLVSEYQKVSTDKQIPNVIMGFAANYATVTHENVGAKFNRPGSGAKFLESSLKRNASKILSIIGNEAKL